MTGGGYRVDEEHLRGAEEGDVDAAKARERLERRLADQELVAHLALRGFTGRGWEEGLAPDLAHYGMSVLRAWIGTGMIFKRCGEKGLRLAPWKRPPTRGEIDDLAAMTAACALRTFRQRALRNKGWDVAGGASLASWFVGCCIYEFPNLWRQREREQKRLTEGDNCALLLESGRPPARDPATVVVDRDQALAILDGMDEKKREIVALLADGYSREEVAEILGMSTRAVEGHLYRLRQNKETHRREKTP